MKKKMCLRAKEGRNTGRKKASVYLRGIMSVFFAFLIVFSLIASLGISSFAKHISVAFYNSETDKFVYAPGVYDLKVMATGADNPTYQWYASVGMNRPVEELYPLSDNENYSGTQTNHLRMATNDSLVYNPDEEGWEAIYFCCKVTDTDGSVAWSNDYNMIIHSYDSLINKLKNDNITFDNVSIESPSGKSTFIKSEGEVKYYEVTGDFIYYGVYPRHSFPVLPSYVRTTSEGELKVETYVTCDGKTSRYDNSSTGYIPPKYGKNILAFRSDLVLYMNGKRMEMLDSVTSVVNVNVGRGIAVGLTKSNTSILEGQYSASRVLATLPKNERVTILKEIGGYYRVAAGGYFGYIPKTALSVMENIESVSVSVPEPVAGNVASKNFTMDDPELYYAKDSLNQEVWYDKTSQRYLSSNDTFISGHSYRLVLWLSAKDGKRFNLSSGGPAVVGKVNGFGAPIHKAYEQDPEEVIELTYDFDHVHDLKKVNRVYPTCTSAGKEYHYKCACGWTFEDNNAQVRITDENWGVIPARGHWESAWKSNGTNHYRVCQRRECGEILSETSAKHTGGKATCTSGAICTVCNLEYGSKGSHTWSSGWDYSDSTGHAHVCTSLCGSHSSIQKHTPGKEATEKEPQVCLDCGYILKQATNHKHELIHFDSKEATCTSAGNKDYWYCPGCTEYFADLKGERKIDLADITINPLGHDMSDIWKIDKDSHWHECRRCKTILENTHQEHIYKDSICTVCAYNKDTGIIPEVNDPETTKGTESETLPDEVINQTETEAGENNTASGAVPMWIIVILIAFSVILIGGLITAIILVIVNKKKNG